MTQFQNMNKYKTIIQTIIFTIIPSPCIASVPAKHSIIIACRILNTDNYRPHQMTCEKYAHRAHMKIIKESQEIQETIKKFDIKSMLKLNANNNLQRTTPQIHPNITPDQARQRIEKNISHAFEGTTNLNHRELLELIKIDAQYLNDPKASKSIQFISENIDKTNMMDMLLFWPAAWQNGDLEGFPIPEEIRKQPRTKVMIKVFEFSKNQSK
jgi:hypothetical protein